MNCLPKPKKLRKNVLRKTKKKKNKKLLYELSCRQKKGMEPTPLTSK